jgi:hypothetical protein
MAHWLQLTWHEFPSMQAYSMKVLPAGQPGLILMGLYQNMDFNRPSVKSNAIIFMNLNPSKPTTLGQYMPLSTMTGDDIIVHQIKLIQDKFILAHDIKAYGCAGIAQFINLIIN